MLQGDYHQQLLSKVIINYRIIDLLANLDVLKSDSDATSHEMIKTFESDNAMHEMTKIYQKLKDKTQVLLLSH